MRSLRVPFLFGFLTLAACGGFLGFGEDDPPEPSPGSEDAAAETSTTPDAGDVDSTSDASQDVDIDAIADEIDASDDVIDQTPIDAGPGVLVEAHFEDKVTGNDGADVAFAMDALKAGSINGQQSAVTLIDRPAYVEWKIPSQDKIFVVFSLRFTSFPTKAGSNVIQVTGPGGITAAIAIGSEGAFVLRSGATGAPVSSKMSENVIYRVGLEVDRNASTLRAGFTTGSSKVVYDVTLAWPNPGAVDTVRIGALTPNAGSFPLAIDDVLATTEVPK